MNVKIEEGWKKVLAAEFDKPYFAGLTDMVRREYSDPSFKVYPPAAQIFAAFDSTPYDEVKVVIIGQDPYHGPGQANGLCFSVNPGIDIPPVAAKHISGDTLRHRHSRSHIGRPVGMGCARSASAQCLTHGARALPQIAFRSGMGDLYRCRRACSGRKPRKSRLPALGIRRYKKRGFHRPQPTSCIDSAPPLSLICVSWLFRLPPLLQGKRIPCGTRQGTRKLVINTSTARMQPEAV